MTESELPCEVHFGREVCGDLQQAERREWWLSNGRGAYAAGTVTEACRAVSPAFSMSTRYVPGASPPKLTFNGPVPLLVSSVSKKSTPCWQSPTAMSRNNIPSC